MFLECELPADWELLSKNESAVIETELARETCEHHLLYRKRLNAIARKIGEDDFLFSLEKGGNILVVVRLTWKYEQWSHLPELKIFKGKDSFLLKYDNLITS